MLCLGRALKGREEENKGREAQTKENKWGFPGDPVVKSATAMVLVNHFYAGDIEIYISSSIFTYPSIK